MDVPKDYHEREQMLVKHELLKSYLERFAPIIGTWCDSITYVDCFSGPWESRNSEYGDTSFGIALKYLRRARVHREKSARQKSMRIRCFFVEEDPDAANRLKAFAASITDVEIEVRNSSFQNAIPDIVRFIREDSSTFPFYFIDPKGWTGFGMQTIRPLFEFSKAEVLVNLMSSFLRRFIGNERESESLSHLFGRSDYSDLIRKLQDTDGIGREEAIVRVYCEELKKCGAFKFLGNAYIIHNKKDDIYYHLIFGSRSIKGLEVFRDAEKSAMRVMEEARQDIAKRMESQRPQLFLPAVDQLPRHWAYYEELRERQITLAKKALLSLLKSKMRVRWDVAWEQCLSSALVWRSDVMSWIDEWKESGELSIEGLAPRKSRLELNQGLILNWHEKRSLIDNS